MDELELDFADFWSLMNAGLQFYCTPMLTLHRAMGKRGNKAVLRA